jgi:hypothetical protein
MPTYERTPQRLTDWLAAGNDMPQFLAGHIEAYLAARPTPIAAGVSVSPDGRVTFDTDAPYQALDAALSAMTAADLDPERERETQYGGIMQLLDAFADAVDNGQSPTAAQTRDTVARLVRVVQFLAERRR